MLWGMLAVTLIRLLWEGNEVGGQRQKKPPYCETHRRPGLCPFLRRSSEGMWGEGTGKMPEVSWVPGTEGGWGTFP